MKRLVLIHIVFFILPTIAIGQVGNEQEVLVKNGVKWAMEKHCFANSDGGSCTVIYEKYDRRGNTIEWNMGRLGSLYRHVYDERDNNIMTLWISKSDTTEVDTLSYYFDAQNELIRQVVGGVVTTYENTYDRSNRLDMVIGRSKNYEGHEVIETTYKTWNPSNVVQTETTITKVLKPSSSDACSEGRVDYEYDQQQNLLKETHYREDTVTQTLRYKYDSKNRMIEELEYNTSRTNRVNRMRGDGNEIELFKTTFKYNALGQIEELYTYFSDPCMSLDNHFLYKHFYHDNGLISYVDAYENDRLIFTVTFEYEYF